MDQSYDAPLEDLLRTYREDGGINYLEVATTLPSRPAIDESCVDLLGLLFPGFRGDALVHSSDLPDITRSRIETLHARLQPEVAKSLACERPRMRSNSGPRRFFTFLSRSWPVCVKCSGPISTLPTKVIRPPLSYEEIIVAYPATRSDRDPAHGARLI